MDSVDQRVRHYVVRGIIAEHPALLNVLDLGCGVGTTFEALKDLPILYEGIDLSAVAIAECEKRYSNYPNAKFTPMNFLSRDLTERYDIIVINEAFYYLNAEEGALLLKSLESQLRNSDSLLIVSMSTSAKSKRAWNQIEQTFTKPLHRYGLCGKYPSSQWIIRSFRKGAEAIPVH